MSDSAKSKSTTDTVKKILLVVVVLIVVLCLIIIAWGSFKDTRTSGKLTKVYKFTVPAAGNMIRLGIPEGYVPMKIKILNVDGTVMSEEFPLANVETYSHDITLPVQNGWAAGASVELRVELSNLATQSKVTYAGNVAQKIGTA